MRLNGELTLSIKSDISFEGTIDLYSLTGQAVRSFGRYQFNTGENLENLSIQGLVPGVYTIAVQTAEGNLIQKLVISN